MYYESAHQILNLLQPMVLKETKLYDEKMSIDGLWIACRSWSMFKPGGL